MITSEINSTTISNSKRTKKRVKKKEDLKKKPVSIKETLLKESAEQKKKINALAFEKQQLLHQPTTVITMQDVACYLTPEIYDQVTIERSEADSICGYPLCKNKVKINKNKKFLLENNKVIELENIEISENKLNFCSKICFISSKFYRSQLSDEAVYVRKFETFGKVDVIPLESELSKEKSHKNVNSSELIEKDKFQSAKQCNEEETPLNDQNLVEKKSLVLEYVQDLLNQIPKPNFELIVKENEVKNDNNNFLFKTASKDGDSNNYFDSVEGFQAKAKLENIKEKEKKVKFQVKSEIERGLKKAAAEKNSSSSLKKKFELSLFGQIWTTLDRLSTKKTKLWLNNMNLGENAFFFDYEIDLIRKELFCERILKSLCFKYPEFESKIKSDALSNFFGLRKEELKYFLQVLIKL
ncbi:RNA polymerase II associated protein 2 [Clydaea vesicula]|uniref:RNA polymerase II subunit B1 CTD phosphatase RPAP2 homolog n=1 Tax=Clydaea vesicula TaxID=447962 RepID=A0AAD5TY26_9FUNG|nr:RNA polymerase II associated protein 2 [Clydaea vesicula]